MTNSKRLRKAIDYLKYKHSFSSDAEISAHLGYKRAYLSRILNETVPISNKFLANIEAFDKNINTDWILTGEGAMVFQRETGIDPTDTMDSPKARLLSYLKHKDLTINDFCLTLSVNEAFVEYLSEGINYDDARLIAYHFPDINIFWLKTGEEKMLAKGPKFE